MKKISGVVVIGVFFLIASNVIAGLQAIEQTDPPQASNYRVLWDASHGGFINYTPTGYYQPLIQNLAPQGFRVDTTNQGFLAEDLTEYHILVICLGSAWKSSYSSIEVARIKSFVNDGGGLLIMGDNTVCPNSNIQPVASSFGVSLGRSLLDPYETYSSILASHAIFNNVREIYMLSGGEISARVPSNEVAWEEGTGKALVAVGSYGNGRVVTLGDMDCWVDHYVNFADNRQFAINTFEYLAVPEPGMIVLIGFGGVALLKKSR